MALYIFLEKTFDSFALNITINDRRGDVAFVIWTFFNSGKFGQELMHCKNVFRAEIHLKGFIIVCYNQKSISYKIMSSCFFSIENKFGRCIVV